MRDVEVGHWLQRQGPGAADGFDQSTGAVRGDAEFLPCFGQPFCITVRAVGGGLLGTVGESAGAEDVEQGEGEVGVCGSFVDELAGIVGQLTVVQP
ncbi:hypothetical protein [Streptomyces sp. NPDC017529]|uniref:hypothetical protein n=1 Tax=Streptomyces sp. NPDC017529 TaxID=3365000 RepID=UPI00378AACD4